MLEFVKKEWFDNPDLIRERMREVELKAEKEHQLRFGSRDKFRIDEIKQHIDFSDLDETK